jgi:hypothetical protein
MNMTPQNRVGQQACLGEAVNTGVKVPQYAGAKMHQ